MSPSDHALRAGSVQLLDVTAGILEELLDVALADAAPDDVTPPLGETDGWNPERIGWFRQYHRAAAAGLDGPAAQKTWAIRPKQPPKMRPPRRCCAQLVPNWPQTA